MRRSDWRWRERPLKDAKLQRIKGETEKIKHLVDGVKKTLGQ